jgi:hypothetical protein
VKKLLLYFLYIIGLQIITAYLTSIQTSLWYHFFGSFAGPMLWLLIIVYLNIYKKPLEAILLSYFIGVQIYYFGWIPLGFLFSLILILFSLTWLVKERIFWPGPGYFMYASAASVVAYHIIYVVCSWMFESIHVKEFNLVDRIAQCLITPLFAIPVFYILKYLERWTDQTPLIETGEYQL